MKYYSSPRWSQEILDCSMPMTMDTYNKCSYNCLYCFSYFQKSHTLGKGGSISGKQDYQAGTDLTWVDPEKIKRIFNMESETIYDKQFQEYIKERRVMQWGGLSDQFDNYERKHGITLELLKYFKKLNYPLCFSTKATWWLEDERYVELFRGQDNWNVKFSIICLDEKRASIIEKGVDSPQKRIEAIRKYTKLNKGGATLRLRPFIIGLSDRDGECWELIRQAADAGATAVSTEFFCVEGRADDRLKERYKQMEQVLGYDLLSFYKRHSATQGYYRLNLAIKEPYIVAMKQLCDELGLRFYVSDAHFKEYCHNGSCCGLPEGWAYSKGQFTEALLIAKKNGVVHWSDIEADIDKLHGYSYRNAAGFNTNSAENRAIRVNQSMKDYIREAWNTPNSGRSPYKYFEGVLLPIGLDEQKNVIYKYNAKDTYIGAK